MTSEVGPTIRWTIVDLIVGLMGRAYLLALYHGPRSKGWSGSGDGAAGPPIDRYPLS